MKNLIVILASFSALILATIATAGEFDTTIPLRAGDAATFYVKAEVGDSKAMDFMVDTGSGYMTINEDTLVILQGLKQAQYQREQHGVLANGTEIVVPIYQLSHFNIGGCMLNNLEAAVFPGKTRQILGLNALRQAGPFIFSFDPPKLVLSNCLKEEVSVQQTENNTNG